MKYFKPIGCHFADNAKFIAGQMHHRPVLELDSVGLAVGSAVDDHYAPAVMMLRDGFWANRPIEGFVKPTKPRHTSHNLAIAWIMSYLGLPSAPYLLIRGGDMKLPIVYAKERHRSGMALFSPKVFDRMDREPNRERPDKALQSRWCSTGFTDRETDGVSLAAAGQARAWIHDWDGCATNIVRDTKTKAVCLLDHEVAEPWNEDYWDGECMVKAVGLHQDNRNLIRQGWGSRDSSQGRADYVSAARDAADRIHTLRRRDLQPLVEVLHASGLPEPRRLLNGLLKRRALFERPVGLEGAERAGFNLGWRKSKFYASTLRAG